MTRSTIHAGRPYTLGEMKHPCGDRSYIGHIWEVIETNGSHAVIRSMTAKSDFLFGYHPTVVSVDEFDWTPADGMLQAIADHILENEI